jgi:uncharacterized membrane protein
LRNETRARSLAKTVVYRIVAIVMLAVITYVFTGNLGETTVVSVLFNAGGALAYYGLERYWDGVHWGLISSGEHAERTGPAPQVLGAGGLPVRTSHPSQE